MNSYTKQFLEGIYEPLFFEMDTNPTVSSETIEADIYSYTDKYILNVYFENVFDYTDEKIDIRIFTDTIRLDFDVCISTATEFTCDFTIGNVERFYQPFFKLDEPIQVPTKTLRFILKKNQSIIYMSAEYLQEIHIDDYLSSSIAYTSGSCGTSMTAKCPGFIEYIGLPCSGQGRCNRACYCICDQAPDAIANSVLVARPPSHPALKPRRTVAPDAKKHARDTMGVPWNRYAPERAHDQNGQCICNHEFSLNWLPVSRIQSKRRNTRKIQFLFESRVMLHHQYRS